MQQKLHEKSVDVGLKIKDKDRRILNFGAAGPQVETPKSVKVNVPISLDHRIPRSQPSNPSPRTEMPSNQTESEAEVRKTL